MTAAEARARMAGKRMREWIARQFCKWGRCIACAIHDVPEGIGGKCIRCGKIHGWVTREELIAYAERDARALRGDWEQLGRDFQAAKRKLH